MYICVCIYIYIYVFPDWEFRESQFHGSGRCLEIGVEASAVSIDCVSEETFRDLEEEVRVTNLSLCFSKLLVRKCISKLTKLPV